MKKRLKDIANIRSGCLFRHKLRHDENGNVSVVQLRDVNESGQLVYENFTKIIEDKPEKYEFLNTGDVLFKAKSIRKIAAVVDKSMPNLVASVHYFIISINNDIVIPKYLAWFLNQQPAQNYFNQNAMGTRVPIINKRVVEEISITIPDRKKQELIINVNKLKKREQALLSAIKERKETLINKLLVESLKK